MLLFGKNKNSESRVTGTSGSGQDSKAVVASIITDELKKLVVMKFSDKACSFNLILGGNSL